MKLLLLNRINCVRVRKKLDYNQCFVRDNRWMSEQLFSIYRNDKKVL